MKRIATLAAIAASTLAAACGEAPLTADQVCKQEGSSLRAGSAESDALAGTDPQDAGGEARCVNNLEVETDGPGFDVNKPGWYSDEAAEADE